MKQIVQDLKTGETRLLNVPRPMVLPGHVLIRTHRSVVSQGTEKMLVDFGKANYWQKARQQPEKVKQVLDKMKTDGIRPTVEAVFRKLGEPLPLGYCNAGEVLAVGKGVDDFRVGDRVVSNGHHAEVVSIPKNLVAKIPEGVSYSEAAFTVVGAIALQGIRLVAPTFGETVVVTGLGLIGLLTVQLLKGNGCQVIGLDIDPEKVALAKQWGIDALEVDHNLNPVEAVLQRTNGIGADAVILTASSSSDEIIAQAAQMSRKRGRIILVGVVGLHLQRSDFYEKELSFQVSCSYGPGRYDDQYELHGQDYPLPYVRWTEQRNFTAVLTALAQRTLEVKSLVTHEVPLDDYQSIYGDLAAKDRIASLIQYPVETPAPSTAVTVTETKTTSGSGQLGIIGAGNFTKAVVVPTLKKLGANIKYLASARGLSATTLAEQYGIPLATTDVEDILQDKEVQAILITTRHNLHAAQVEAALHAGKQVFVEKPLALTNAELDAIATAQATTNGSVTVGFNRRFSPFITHAKAQLGNSAQPLNVIATMNAGYIPSEVWVHDSAVGGGRIIGEACHLIDLITYLTGSTVASVVMNALGPNPAVNTDNASILLRYHNGAQGIINYFSNGSKVYPKERVEVYSHNRTMVIDNFRQSHYYGFKAKGLRKRQDKGHNEQFKRFLAHVKEDAPPPIPFQDIMNTSRAAIAAVHSLQMGHWVDVQ